MKSDQANLEEPLPDNPGDSGSGHAKKDRRAWSRFGIAGMVLTVMFFRPLITLVKLALKSDLHSHVLLVPGVAGYLIWIGRHRLSPPGPPAVVPAVLFAIAAIGCLGASELGAPSLQPDVRLALRILGLILSLVGCVGALLGRTLLRECAFPLAFLVFMVPLPEAVSGAMETALQYASAEVAEWFFLASDTPLVRDGLYFRFPGLSIQVAQECSGFRSSWVLFMVGILAARLLLVTSWKRAVLVVFVVPLGVVRNAFRVWTLVILSLYLDPAVIHSWLHHRGGPIFFLVSLIPLFLLLWWLVRSERGLPRQGKFKSMGNSQSP